MPDGNESQSDESTASQPADQWRQPGQWGSSTPDWGQQHSTTQPVGQPPGSSAESWHQPDPSQGWQHAPASAPQPQPGGFFGQSPGGYGGPHGQPPPPQQPSPGIRRIADANPFRAAFDFGFNSYATPGLVKIIYVLATILAVIWWIGGTIMTFITGAAITSLGNPYGGGGAGGIVLGVFALLLGWIPALLWLLLVRIVLEASTALVRLADDMRRFRQNAGT
jgi:hypothetical protein